MTFLHGRLVAISFMTDQVNAINSEAEAGRDGTSQIMTVDRGEEDKVALAAIERSRTNRLRKASDGI